MLEWDRPHRMPPAHGYDQYEDGYGYEEPGYGREPPRGPPRRPPNYYRDEPAEPAWRKPSRTSTRDFREYQHYGPPPSGERIPRRQPYGEY